MEALKIILPIVSSLFIFGIGLLLQYFTIILKIKEEMGGINVKVSTLETKMELFWRCMENKVVDMIKTFPTNIKKDVLLDKMLTRDLILEEAVLLKTILEGELKTVEKNAIGYILVLSRLEQVIVDLKVRK